MFRITTVSAFAVALAAMAFSEPAIAKVHEASDRGFVLRHAVDVAATPQAAWDVLIKPAKWWSDKHSFSGDAANLSLDLRAGGCFCEVLPSKISPNAAPRGSVEHMRVVYVERPRALRLAGLIGPLQSSAAQGKWTIFLKPLGTGTRIMWEYVVGGYLRSEPQTLATSVDLVLAQQIMNLGNMLGMSPQPAADQGGNEQSNAQSASIPPEEFADDDDSDFAREMEAGLKEADGNSASRDPLPRPVDVERPDAPKQPTFIGR